MGARPTRKLHVKFTFDRYITMRQLNILLQVVPEMDLRISQPTDIELIEDAKIPKVFIRHIYNKHGASAVRTKQLLKDYAEVCPEEAAQTSMIRFTKMLRGAGLITASFSQRIGNSTIKMVRLQPIKLSDYSEKEIVEENN